VTGLLAPEVTGTVRSLKAADVEGGLALSGEAGWNQTAEDWAFMIGTGRPIGIEESGRGLLASALVLPLGPRISWISMVLVARTHRRRGFGTALLQRCIESVREAGGVPGLDATEVGRPVYLPLGFRDLYPISRWVLDLAPSSGQSHPRSLAPRPVSVADLDAISRFDEPRSSMQRRATLRYLQGRWPSSRLAESNGRLAGFALGRPGRSAAQIGPVVAEDSDVAITLIKASIRQGGRFMLDVPDAHSGLTRFLVERGAVRERGYMRMALGDAPELAEPGAVFALAGPELG
jgi:GNAT superfamily N-acetyltransferase